MREPHSSTDRVRRPPRLWSADEYVKERRFCPLEDIQKSMDHYCASSGIDELVLLSIDANVCLRTLCFVAHADTSAGRLLQQAITHDPFRVRDTSAENPLWRQLDAAVLGAALDQLAEPGRYERAVSNSFFGLLSRLHDEAPWQIVGETFRPHSEIAVNCVALQRGGSTTRGKAFLRNVTAFVNGTANASAYRDRKVTTQVDRALHEVSQQATGTNADLFMPLVRMARRVTQSSAAAVYFYDGTMERDARLVAASSDALGGYTLRRRLLPEVDRYERSELAAASFSQERPLLLSEGLSERGLRSTWMHGEDDVPYELAVPIPAAPGGGSTPNSGVIVLGRGAHPPNLAYGNYELALVRNVALRIALLRTSLMMDEAGLAIASAAGAFAVADAGPGSGVGRKVWYSGAQDSRAGKTKKPLPEDLQLAIRHLAPIIEFAGRLTGSHSVTLRLLVRGGSARGQYNEPTLLRAVAWPAWRLDEPHCELRLDDLGVNAWVARTGRSCYLRDIAKPDALSAYEGLTEVVRVPKRNSRAELCVPVFVDERLTATVNFENPTPNAFALLSNVARGCAAMVALAIASVRRRHLRDVLSIGSDVQSSAHDLTGLADRLRDAVERRLDMHEAMRDALKTLDEVIPILRAEEPERAEPDSILLDTISRAAVDAGITTFRRPVLQMVAGSDVTVEWNQLFARRFYLAMFEVFRNVVRHGSLDGSGFPELFFRRREIGGRIQIEIDIVHGLRPAPVASVTNLYRVPIKAHDRLHFGAYTAGAIVRSLGGDVLARRIDGNRMLILVSVPVEQ